MYLRSQYERQLQWLQDEVLLLGSMAEKAIDRAIDVLRRRDQDEARQLIDDDATINRKRWEIEERCIELIATQQPAARDLRTIVAILNIVGELERIGDYAEGIAKITLLHGDEPLLKPLVDIPRMADLARSMLRRSLDAFVNRDIRAAKLICGEDDEVDALHDRVYRELLNFMLEDPRTINRATYLTWVAHNLERIADRTTNICERVVFLVTGQIEELNVSRY